MCKNTTIKGLLKSLFELSALEYGEELYSLTGFLWCFVEHSSGLRQWPKVLQYDSGVTSLGRSGACQNTHVVSK